MATLTKFSRARLSAGAVIDIAACDDASMRRWLQLTPVVGTASGNTNTAFFVINTTKKHPLGILGYAATLQSAYISVGTVPAGGTLTWKIVSVGTDGTTEINLTDTAGTDPEAATARVPQAQTLATTNVALAAGTNLELHCIASNATVTQDAVEVRVMLGFLPSASTGITATSSYSRTG